MLTEEKEAEKKRILMDELSLLYGLANNIGGLVYHSNYASSDVFKSTYPEPVVPAHEVLTPLPLIEHKFVVPEPEKVDLAIDVSYYDDCIKNLTKGETKNAYEHLVNAGLDDVADEYLNIMGVC